MQPAGREVPFPRALQELISHHRLRENEIAEIFKDRNVLNAYHQWCEANRPLADNHPAFKLISQVADRFVGQAQAVAEVAARVVQPAARPDPIYQFLDRWIENSNRGFRHNPDDIARAGELLFKQTEKFAEALKTYYETGLIPRDEIIEFLKIQNNKGETLFVNIDHYTDCLIPLMDEIGLSREQFVRLLIPQEEVRSVLEGVVEAVAEREAESEISQFLDRWIESSNRGVPPTPEALNRAQELLFNHTKKFAEALSAYHDRGLISRDQIMELLKIQDERGETILHQYSIDCLIPLMKKIGVTAGQLFELLKIQDSSGATPLQTSAYLLFPLIEAIGLTSEQFAALLKIKDVEGRARLGDKTGAEIYIPFMKKIGVTNEQLVEILKIKDQYGTTPLHRYETLVLLLPLMQELRVTNVQLFELLKIQDKGGRTPLHKELTLRPLIPFMARAGLTNEQLVELLKIQDKDGTSLLLDVESLETFIPLMERVGVTNVQLVELLKIRGREGNTLLHKEWSLKRLIPLMERIGVTNVQLVELLKIQDKEGYTPLYYENLLQYLIPLMQRVGVTNVQLVELFKIQEKHGYTLLIYEKLYESFIPLMERAGVTNEQLVELLKIQDKIGNTVLHYNYENLEHLNFVMQLTPAQLFELFKIKNEEGNTPFTMAVVRYGFIPKIILDRLSRNELQELLQIENNRGVSVGLLLAHLSDRWLVSPKAAVRDRQPMSVNEYDAKMAELERKLAQLRARIIFGNEPGQVNPIILTKEGNREERWTKEEFNAALDVMLGKIRNREAWVGTPFAGEPAKILAFYSEMLSDLIVVVDELSKKDKPDEIAGFLVGIAKTELDQRCAAAYMGEINQAAMILGQNIEQRSFPSVVQRSMEMLLLDRVEQISRHFGNDVHEFNQLRYAVGLASEPDPLAHERNIEVYRSMVKESLKQVKIVPSFVARMQAAPREVKDMMLDWFTEKMPEQFDVNHCKERYQVAIAREGQIREDFLKTLGNLNENQKASLVRFLALPEGVRLQRLPFSQELSRILTGLKESNPQRYSELMLLTDVEEIEDFSRNNDLMPRAPAGETLANRRARLESRRKDFQALAVQNARMKKIKEILGAVDDRTVEEVDARINEFNEKMNALGRGLNVDYHAAGLPSRAIDQERRYAFAEQFYTDKGELNSRGAIGILHEFDIIEIL